MGFYSALSLGLFLCLGILSSFFAHYPLYALLEVSTFLACIMSVLYFSSLMLIDRNHFLCQGTYFLLFTFSTFALTTCIAWLGLHNQGQTAIEQAHHFLAAPGYMNPRFYDDVQCMLLPLLVGLCLKPHSSKTLRLFIFILLTDCQARAFLGGSRIYDYEALALFIALPLIFKKQAIPFLATYGASLFSGFILYLLLYGSASDMLHSLSNLDGRGLLWSLALKLALQHPILGVGPLHFNFYAYPLEGPLHYAAHPHNVPLAIASEWGFPALLCALAFIMLGLYSWLKSLDRNPQTSLLSLCLSASLIAAGLMMQVDGLIFMPAGQSMFCFVLALIFAESQIHALKKPQSISLPHATLQIDQASTTIHEIKKANHCQKRRLKQTLFLLACLTPLCFIFAIGLPLFFNMPAIIFHFFTANTPPGLLSPNYWSQGFIQFYPG